MCCASHPQLPQGQYFHRTCQVCIGSSPCLLLHQSHCQTYPEGCLTSSRGVLQNDAIYKTLIRTHSALKPPGAKNRLDILKRGGKSK